MSKSAVTCSAPGKILLTGGYLVLDPSHTGLVLSLSARIFTTVSKKSGSNHDKNQIIVKSPQFPGAIWQFKSANGVLESTSQSNNPFVKEALFTVLSYFQTLDDFESFEVSILADNQYYSIPPSSSPSSSSYSSSATARFSKSSKSITETSKTGLGSSAALITSLCASLFLSFSPAAAAALELTESNKSKIHNLSQIAHCKAQGKVGSGFDVASAVFGSCLYSRFPPSLIDSLPLPPSPPPHSSSSSSSSSAFEEAVKDVVDTIWPMQMSRITLKETFKVLMGDVKQGSATPGMIKKVMGCQAALDIWPSLAISNDVLADYLIGSTTARIDLVRDATRAVRGLLKEMGVVAGVEIEPDEQSDVLDETLKIDGVVSCGVPGAGGYDAIFAIVQKDGEGSTQKVEEAVERLWSGKGIERIKVIDDGLGVKIESDFDYSI